MSKQKPVNFTFISLFPDFLSRYAKMGIVARAISRGLVNWQTVNLREFGVDARKTVDDRPFGGGVGMVLRPDVVYKALKSVLKQGINSNRKSSGTKVVLLSASGKKFTQTMAKSLSQANRLVFISGRYEGVDSRVSKFVDLELSIGDYVLMGGELPSLVIAEAVMRHIPGVLGKSESAQDESFTGKLLEYPHFTKPVQWKVKSKGKLMNLSVPEVLRSGNHQKIQTWREEQSLKVTKKNRPDLL